jgi:hypothetical protein
MTTRHDLGMGFAYSFFIWAPDRELNPQYADEPDIDPAGITIWRLEPIEPGQVARGDDDEPEGMIWTAVGACWFNSPQADKLRGQNAGWDLYSIDPLHIEPSVQMYEYDSTKAPKSKPSHHGWIRGGRWVPA